MKKVKVSYRIGYDSMNLSITYPSGGRFKWSINRSGERLMVGFSNDRVELAAQTEKIKSYLLALPGTNKERMDAAKVFFEMFTSGREAIDAIQVQTSKQLI